MIILYCLSSTRFVTTEIVHFNIPCAALGASTHVLDLCKVVSICKVCSGVTFLVLEAKHRQILSIEGSIAASPDNGRSRLSSTLMKSSM